MNDQQSEELIKQVKRIADVLERISPPTKESSSTADLSMGSGNHINPELQKLIEDTIRSKAGKFYKEHNEKNE
jgi:hypothetical protein